MRSIRECARELGDLTDADVAFLVHVAEHDSTHRAEADHLLAAYGHLPVSRRSENLREFAELGPTATLARLTAMIEQASTRIANAAEIVEDAPELATDTRDALAAELVRAQASLCGCAPPRGSARAYDPEASAADTATVLPCGCDHTPGRRSLCDEHLAECKSTELAWAWGRSGLAGRGPGVPEGWTIDEDGIARRLAGMIGQDSTGEAMGR